MSRYRVTRQLCKRINKLNLSDSSKDKVFAHCRKNESLNLTINEILVIASLKKFKANELGYSSECNSVIGTSVMLTKPKQLVKTDMMNRLFTSKYYRKSFYEDIVAKTDRNVAWDKKRREQLNSR